MASSSSKILICFALMAAALLQCACAASHTVGGTTGWTIPPSASLYPNWASSQSFKDGDTLVFNFPTSVHNVMEVSKSEYDACTSVTPLDTYTVGPATVNLNRTGTYYFLCSVGQHCANGQKITINVLAATSPAASPASSPPAASPALSPPAKTPSVSPASPEKSPAAAPTSPSPVSSPPPSTVISTPPTAEGPGGSTPESPAGSPVSTPPSAAPSVAMFGWVTLLAVTVPLFFCR